MYTKLEHERFCGHAKRVYVHHVGCLSSQGADDLSASLHPSSHMLSANHAKPTFHCSNNLM